MDFFEAPRKILNDLGTEFRAHFEEQAERDGSEVVPGSLEAPTQRGLTERAGGISKDILYKTMATYTCTTLAEWKELVDVTRMTRNRLLLRAGYSPIQRVLGYTPRLPGGLLSGGEHDVAAADLQRIGDVEACRAMRMRKAASFAFHEADSSRGCLSRYPKASGFRDRPVGLLLEARQWFHQENAPFLLERSW